MKCVMCSNTDSSVLKLQTYVNNNTLKEITFVLPDLEIPTSQGPVYVCVTCEKQVATFYTVKKTSLESLYHLNHYEDILRTSSDVKFNDLKIIIESNTVSAQHEQDIEFKHKLSCNFFTEVKDELIETSANLTSTNKISSNQLACNKTRFKCGQCEQTFMWRRNLLMHVVDHTGQRPTCQSNVQKPARAPRKRVLTAEKPYECDVCQKKFAQKIHLITHTRTHTNERPYLCKLCNKAFSQSSNLSKHMPIHTGVKPHQCHICMYKCTRPCTLKRHIRTHSVPKPCKCEFCLKSFTNRKNLNRHIRKIHDNVDLNLY